MKSGVLKALHILYYQICALSLIGYSTEPNNEVVGLGFNRHAAVYSW